MKDKRKTKGQLIKKIVKLPQKRKELETKEKKPKRRGKAPRESEGEYRILVENANEVI